MARPVIGVIGNTRELEGRFAVQFTGERNMRSIAAVTGAMPLLFAGNPEITDVGALLDIVDGILLTGGRANVHPSYYGASPDPAYEPYDQARDAVAIPVVRACIERNIPIFGVCRGLQELNVAFGGTLHPEIRDLPGRINHRMPRLDNGEIHPDPNVLFGERHDVHLTTGGEFHELLGRETIRVNSLHGQGILEPGQRIIVEGVADDSTIEAISIEDAPGFALGVQWHAEYEPEVNHVNGALFKAFGAAVAACQMRRSAKM